MDVIDRLFLEMRSPRFVVVLLGILVAAVLMRII
jgi:hypothetical protein